MARLDQSPKTVSINDLSHDGRGVARWPDGHANAGKTVFVSGALPGEIIRRGRKLRIIAGYGAGYDGVDVRAAAGFDAAAMRSRIGAREMQSRDC